MTDHDPSLTDQARANLASGATDGPGTDTCRGCGGPKEPSRLNSARCRACGQRKANSVRPARTTRTMRTDLPADVWDRLAAEAAAHGRPVGAYLRDLIVARDTRKHSGASPSTVSRNDGTDRKA